MRDGKSRHPETALPRTHRAPSYYRRLIGFSNLVYAVTVRKIRKGHGNALIGLCLAITQTLLIVAVFYFMFTVIGMRGTQIRGDFILFLMSGVFLFMTYNSAMGAVLGAEGPTAPMMQHAPMNTIVAILSSAFASLFTQTLSLVVVLGVYHLGWGPITIDQPLGALCMLLLSWFSGSCIGLIFLAFRPWAPDAVRLLHTIYSRANMIASGKMFLANAMPGFLLAWFDWNPLFHTIDQARGFTFLNYNPHYSSVLYPLQVSIVLLILGLMAEYVTRKNASLSWSAGQ